MRFHDRSLLGETGIHRSVPRKGRAMDRLEAMSIVLAVAEAGSLSAAARRLNTPPATASRKITELEEHLRAKLFDRSGRRLTFTDSGLSYVAALKRILADPSEADRAASGEFASPTGELIVSAPTELGRLHLIPILAEFLRAYPDIDVRLLLVERIVSLPEAHVDLAVRVGVLPDSRLIALRVGTIRRVVCASPAYLEARGTPKTPEDLAGHDCIVYEGFLGPDVWKFIRIIRQDESPRRTVQYPPFGGRRPDFGSLIASGSDPSGTSDLEFSALRPYCQRVHGQRSLLASLGQNSTGALVPSSPSLQLLRTYPDIGARTP